MKDLGEILKTQRKKYKYTYSDVQQKIKIHPNYVRALEENNYSLFDSKVHALGFLRIYSTLLGLNVDQILALWRREHSSEFPDDLDSSEPRQKLSKIISGTFSFSFKKLLIFFGSVVLIGFFGYLFYSYKTYQGPPLLELSSPEDNKIVKSNPVDIIGKTDIDATLLVNGERVLLRPDGSFAVSVNLHEGLNTLSITSINKLDKKTEKVLTLILRSE